MLFADPLRVATFGRRLPGRCHRRTFKPLTLREHPFHRAAGRDLHDHEIEGDDPEQRQRDQRQAAEDIREHRRR